MEIIAVVKDLIVGLAWPLLLLFIAIFFRREIRSRIQDLQEAGPGGLKFHQPVGPSAEPTFSVQVAGDKKEAAALPPTVPAVLEQEEAIRELLKQHSDKDVKELLTRELAISHLRLRCEVVFAAIFDSQINFLNLLVKSDGKLDETLSTTFFEGIKAQMPGVFDEAVFEDWYRYLETSGLTERRNGTIYLTNFGSTFTEYALERRTGLPRLN